MNTDASKARYEVAASPFHGGRLLGRYQTLAAAVRAARRHDCRAHGGCLCGGPRIAEPGVAAQPWGAWAAGIEVRS